MDHSLLSKIIYSREWGKGYSFNFLGEFRKAQRVISMCNCNCRVSNCKDEPIILKYRIRQIGGRIRFDIRKVNWQESSFFLRRAICTWSEHFNDLSQLLEGVSERLTKLRVLCEVPFKLNLEKDENHEINNAPMTTYPLTPFPQSDLRIDL